MRALVIYESMFGNTEQIARAVGEGLGEKFDVTVAEVGNAPDVIGDGTDLLVVGGPTHALGMSRPGTRKSARGQAKGEIVSRERGIREWLKGLIERKRSTAATAFDTRVKVRFMPGSAARGACRVLRKRGFRVAHSPESFWVEGTTGPLRSGEVDRAREWGRALATGSRQPLRIA